MMHSFNRTQNMRESRIYLWCRNNHMQPPEICTDECFNFDFFPNFAKVRAIKPCEMMHHCVSQVVHTRWIESIHLIVIVITFDAHFKSIIYVRNHAENASLKYYCHSKRMKIRFELEKLISLSHSLTLYTPMVIMSISFSISISNFHNIAWIQFPYRQGISVIWK